MMNTADLLLTTYANLLGSLDGWLAKAAEHPDGDALLERRLAEDMFPLARQVRDTVRMPLTLLYLFPFLGFLSTAVRGAVAAVVFAVRGVPAEPEQDGVPVA